MQQLRLAHFLCSGQLNVTLEKAQELLSPASNSKLGELDKKFVMLIMPYAYFLQEKYSNAIAYLNKEFLLADESYLNDKARWLELQCFFMMGDNTSFQSKWRAWDRQLKKINSGFVWEGYLMAGLKRAFNKPKKERQELMKKLYQQILPFEPEMRTSFMGAIDVLLWVESIAIGKPTAILLKEKYLG